MADTEQLISDGLPFGLRREDPDPIMCGACHRPVPIPDDPQPDDFIQCACGNCAPFEEVRSHVLEFVEAVVGELLSPDSIAGRPGSYGGDNCTVEIRGTYRFYARIFDCTVSQ